MALTNQAALLDHEKGQPREALPLAEEVYLLATDQGFTPRAQQIKPILDAARSHTGQITTAGQTAGQSGLASLPHQRAEPARAAQLNMQYQEALAHWKSLPWWKRLRTKKSEDPRRI
jgi:hypothetical protein